MVTSFKLRNHHPKRRYHCHALLQLVLGSLVASDRSYRSRHRNVDSPSSLDKDGRTRRRASDRPLRNPRHSEQLPHRAFCRDIRLQ
uniref:Uncharacterized protein n=1 Tax=Anopheles dirus TaxID=7168 RepID=A0A182NY47_9DIPT